MVDRPVLVVIITLARSGESDAWLACTIPCLLLALYDGAERWSVHCMVLGTILTLGPRVICQHLQNTTPTKSWLGCWLVNGSSDSFRGSLWSNAATALGRVLHHCLRLNAVHRLALHQPELDFWAVRAIPRRSNHGTLIRDTGCAECIDSVGGAQPTALGGTV